MGNSLHNKIYLGRTSVLGSRPVQVLVLACTFLSMSLIWLAIRSLN